MKHENLQDMTAREKEISRKYYHKNKKEYSYDYENQVWIVDSKYQDCGHPTEIKCSCYGRLHAGENAVITGYCAL